MKKLDEALLKNRDEIIARLNARRKDVSDAVDTYNKAMQNAWYNLHDAVSIYNNAKDIAFSALFEPSQAYNDVVADARSFAEDAGDEIQKFIDSRPDSDKDKRYSAWRNQFDQFNPQDVWPHEDKAVEIPEPDKMVLEAADVAKALEALSVEFPGDKGSK